MPDITTSNVTYALKDLASHAELAQAGFLETKAQLIDQIFQVLNSDDPTARRLAKQQIEQTTLPQMATIFDGLAQATSTARYLADQMPSGSTAAATGSIGTTAAGTATVGVPGQTEDEQQTQQKAPEETAPPEGEKKDGE